MLSTHHNPEVGHYIERSWEPIFQPLNPEYVNTSRHFIKNY